MAGVAPASHPLKVPTRQKSNTTFPIIPAKPPYISLALPALHAYPYTSHLWAGEHNVVISQALFRECLREMGREDAGV